jgi:hypothetical protein
MNAPPIEPGQRLFDWQILAVQNRQATCRCRCNAIRIVAIADLIAGICTSCGCSTPTTTKVRAIRDAHQQRQRQKNFSWKLERGR